LELWQSHQTAFHVNAAETLSQMVYYKYHGYAHIVILYIEGELNMPEELKYTLKQLENHFETPFQEFVLFFMQEANFDSMYVDEDNTVIFYRKNEPFSIQEYREGTYTHTTWNHIQYMWNKGDY
jgi:hypothetical protein